MAPDSEVVKLIYELQHGNPEARAVAAQKLGHRAEARSIPYLIQALSSRGWFAQHRSVAQEATNALLKIGRPAVLPLCASLPTLPAREQIPVVQILGQIGDPRAIDPISHLLGGNRLKLRQASVQALGQIGDARAIPHLLTILDKDIELMRGQAAEALGQIGDPAAVEALIACLQDDGGGVRARAAAALAQIGDARAMEPLALALADEELPTVQEAIDTAIRRLERNSSGF
jgi:HEAT repeat protein